MRAAPRRGRVKPRWLAGWLAAWGLAVSAAGPAPLDDQARLVAALRGASELNPARGLAHVSHVCDLLVEGERYPVADVRELVRGATTPRGVNRIVVLSPGLLPVRRLPYAGQRPLLCRGNRLYLFGAVRLDELPPEGNVLVFSDKARRVRVETVDVNDWPIYPGR